MSLTGFENMKCPYCEYVGLPWFDACPKCERGNLANDLLEILKEFFNKLRAIK